MDNFLKYQNEIASIQYTINLLLWELKINAPKDSEKDLIDLISYHEKNLFSMQTSIQYSNLLKAAMESLEYQTLSEEEKRYIQNLLRHYEKNKKVPTDFYEEYSKMKATANVVWRRAKEKNNYKLFEPYLRKIIELTKKYYKYIYPNIDNLYDAMLNEYEIGIGSELIDKLFSDLKNGIIHLIPFEESNDDQLNFDFTEQQLMDCANYLLPLDILKIQ